MVTAMSAKPPDWPGVVGAGISIKLVHVALVLALSVLSLVHAKSECLRFADYNNINQAFTDGGPGTKVMLCPFKKYRLTGPIVFTAADQELATLGYPTGSDRATLLLNGEFSTAIQGDCRRCARITISHLIIDGNRGKLGRIVDASMSTGLIVIGGNEGQTVRSCLIQNPRGFTAIHVREGDKLQCRKAVIEKNEIGPVGEEYDPDVDGSDPETSPLGRPLADGVSIACRDSLVRGNLFYDNTDAAIVVYGSPGSHIRDNTITSRSLSSMAGILLVDFTPFEGDYTGTVVKSNIIEAASRIIRVGIGLGPSVWSDDTETILKGGSVVGNGIRGRFMGFGISAAGLDGWTIKDNWDEAHHDGKRSPRCFDDVINPEPLPFLYNAKLVTNSDIQPQFVDKVFEYLVCIDGVEGDNAHFKETEARRKVPQAQETETPLEAPTDANDPPEEKSLVSSTGSEVMDDILTHAQTRMLEAIEVLSRRVDTLAIAAKPLSPPHQVAVAGLLPIDLRVTTALADLRSRIGDIEARQQIMIDTTSTLRSALKAWDADMSGKTEWQYDVLLDVQHRLGLYADSVKVAHFQELSDRDGHNQVSHEQRSDLWAQPLRFIVAQAVFILIIVTLWRWWTGSKRAKKL